MDFHVLARRDLQALCKKNKIHANLTNVAMAVALASLPRVEGLEEFMNPTEDKVTQSPDKENPLTQVITRSMTRKSTRRTALKPEKEQLPSCTTGRRSMRNRNAAVADQESKVLIFPGTPAVSLTKKRADADSVQSKLEKEEEDDEKNNKSEVVTERTAVNTVAKTRQEKTRESKTQPTKAYTRRSTRMLEKSMNDLKLSHQVVGDLEPIKMGDLAAEKDLTEEPEDAIKHEHFYEGAQTNVEDNPEENKREIKTVPLADVVACAVEAPVKVENEIEMEEESKSSEIQVAVEVVRSESNLPGSQLIANVQDKESNESENETWAGDLGDFGQKNESDSGKTYIKVENFTREVEVTIGLGNEMGREKESRSRESKTRESRVISNDKHDEMDEFSAEAWQEGLTSVEEAAAEYGCTESEGNVALPDGKNVSELSAQVASLKLDSQKETITDMGSPIITDAVVHDVRACFAEESKMGHFEDDNITNNNGGKNGDGISDRLDNHDDVLSEKQNNAIPNSAEEMDLSKMGHFEDDNITNNNGGKNGDGISDKLDIHDDVLSEKQNNAIPNSAEEMDLCHNVGQLNDVNVTEAEEAYKTVISGAEFVEGAYRAMENTDLEVQESEIRVSADGSETELQEEIFSKKTPASIKKTYQVPPSPLTVTRMAKLPLSEKMHLEDIKKENREYVSELGKEKTTDILMAEGENQKQLTPLQKRSLGGLKKMLREKTKMQNEKRLALQMLQENHMTAVVGDKDD